MKGIKVTDVVDRRISSLVILYENILPEPIQDIFIEYYYKSKEDYVYPSVQMYSENYLYQIENFLTNDDLDIYPMLGIDYLTLSPENFDFIKARQDSKLVVKYSIGYVTQGTIVGIGNNCDYLLKILNKYMKPRFVTNKKFKGI
jgi:hypothetical protein